MATSGSKPLVTLSLDGCVVVVMMLSIPDGNEWTSAVVDQHGDRYSSLRVSEEMQSSLGCGEVQCGQGKLVMEK